MARAKAVLRRCTRTEPSAGAIHVGRLGIDPERREVRVGDALVELTRTEFDILHTLAEHPGRVYTRLQLLEAASGDAFDGLRAHHRRRVKNIRRKLGAETDGERFIGTVIGVGYKLEA